MEDFFMCENIEKTQVVIPRLGQGENLLGAYALEVTGVTKGRGSLFIHTAGAVYMLKSFTGSMEKAQGLAQVLAELKAWDPAVEQILPTREGAYAVREEGGPTYVLKSYQPGRECDVKNAFEVLEGARKLADLHLQLETIETDKKEVFFAPQHLLAEEVRRHNRELKNLRNYIRKKKKKTGFEDLYEQAYGTFYGQGEQVEEEILSLKEELQLCHGDYHHHNVLDCSGTSHIQHFESMRMDSAMSDLAKYTRKALEKNRWNAELGRQMLMTYQRVRPFRTGELQQLYLRLLYPEKFWKIANHYNNNKKTWSSKRDGDKLRQILAQEKARQEFLVLLYNLAE